MPSRSRPRRRPRPQPRHRAADRPHAAAARSALAALSATVVAVAGAPEVPTLVGALGQAASRAAQVEPAGAGDAAPAATPAPATAPATVPHRTAAQRGVAHEGASLTASAHAGTATDALPDDPVAVQRELVVLSLSYDAARREADQADALADDAAWQARVAARAARAARAAFVSDITELYQGTLQPNGLTIVLGREVDSMHDLVEQASSAHLLARSGTASVDEARRSSERAAVLAAAADVHRAEARAAKRAARRLLREIRGRAAEAMAVAAGTARDGYLGAAQQARNEAAVTAWQRYRGDLSRAGVSPPPAAALAAPQALPEPLVPLLGRSGDPVAGVAAAARAGATVAVLPRETVRAVSRALRRVGQPYAVDGSGPHAFDCGGLVTAAWRSSAPAGEELELPSEPAELFGATRSVKLANLQAGDLVFFAEDGSGIHHVGINLGGGLMLAADPGSGQVAVQPFPERPFGATRPTLGGPVGAKDVPAVTADQPLRCGGLPPTTSPGMVLPVPDGEYTISAGFGETGPHWAAGHTGLDFAAPTGTAVLAAKAGTVSVEPSPWAGPHHVVLDHGDGLSTSYAHLDFATVLPGQRVGAGAIIGAIGERGNATGPHLHFEVHVDGVPVDPLVFIAGEGAGAGGWGGHLNGMIPAAALCPLVATPAHRLRCDAARAADELAAAYARHFGRALCLTDSYRSYAQQVSTYVRKPSLAAVPGTSNHGWGLALDLCGGIESFGTPEHAWMLEHAPGFGWIHPDWARDGGGREEPWHWEYGGRA